MMIAVELVEYEEEVTPATATTTKIATAETSLVKEGEMHLL
jgi:hypothetical protein